MNDREWQRIYTDAVRDAFVLGRSKSGDYSAKTGPTINTQIQCLQKELLNMYDLIQVNQIGNHWGINAPMNWQQLQFDLNINPSGFWQVTI